MVRRRPGETDRGYVARLRAVIAADRAEVAILTAEEEADRALSRALVDIRSGAAYGYMTGRRLEDYRRVEALRVALASARALELSDLDARAAVAVTAADAIAKPWRGWWG